MRGMLRYSTTTLLVATTFAAVYMSRSVLAACILMAVIGPAALIMRRLGERPCDNEDSPFHDPPA
jgi:hypothetical protein